MAAFIAADDWWAILRMEARMQVPSCNPDLRLGEFGIFLFVLVWWLFQWKGGFLLRFGQ